MVRQKDFEMVDQKAVLLVAGLVVMKVQELFVPWDKMKELEMVDK